MKKITILLSLLVSLPLMGQVRINEGSNRNGNILADEDNEYDDWIELYNGGANPINLGTYSLSDNKNHPNKWDFPPVSIAANGFQVVYLSKKDRKPLVNHWETAISAQDNFDYIVPTADPISTWTQTGFSDPNWSVGQGNFGYGDGDDNTILPAGTVSVYVRKEFTIADVSKLVAAVLHLDFDDGFVAYLNGVEIARANMGANTYSDLANGQHEANLYQGIAPDAFVLDMSVIQPLLQNGLNTLAFQVHNIDVASSDLSAGAFLSFGISDASSYWNAPPAWFTLSPNGANLHSNFSVSSEGETVYLFQNGLLADSLYLDHLEADYSLGSSTDGSATRSIFLTPSPNASNNNSTAYNNVYELAPYFSLNAGFYPGTVQVSLQAPTFGGTIRYTTDGSTPTINSPLYTSPLSLSQTTVVKARTFSPLAGNLPSKVSTNTYIIGQNIPSSVISISTNSDNLWGPTGIYDNWSTDWKRPCHIEYFDSLNHFTFEQGASIKIDGGAGGSRSQPQRSFRIDADNAVYGEGDIHYPLIPHRPLREQYSSFYLRNGSNMYNIYPYKDAYMLRCTDGMKSNYQEYEPTVVFINGEYWGMYELREKQDRSYFEENYGAEGDELDLLSLSYWYNLQLRAVEGSDTGFYAMRTYIENLNPAAPDFLDRANDFLDVESFTDYIITELYYGNNDWPYNNIKIWRSRETDNKWHYGLIDVELCLYGGWGGPYDNHIGRIFNYEEWIRPINILIQNPDYQRYFINRFADVMNTNFQPARMQAIETQIHDKVLPLLGSHYKRWGNGSGIQNQINDFENFRQGLQNDLAIRITENRNHITQTLNAGNQVNITLETVPQGAGRIQINSIEPVGSTWGNTPWTGVYYDGVPVEIRVIPNPGYTFTGWLPNTYTSSQLQADTLQNLFISGDQTFTAVFTGVLANDIVISEINYNDEPSIDAGNWVELYNFGTAPISLNGWFLKDANNSNIYNFPNSASIAAGGRLCVVADVNNFTTMHPGVSYVGPFTFGLSNSSDQVRLFNNSNQLISSVTYYDSLPWPKCADGQGYTLELTSPTANLNNPSSWFCGCLGGSPGLPYTPCNDPIIFSEINYNSDSTLDSDDWIEIRNVSNSPIDIGNWTFRGDTTTQTYTIPAPRILPPHTNWVLYQTTAKFQQIHPSVTDANGPFGFNISGNGQWIALYNANGIIQQSVRYDDIAPWPLDPDGGGYTLEIVDSSAIFNNGSNWQIGCLGGSPAAYLVLPCVVSNDAPSNISANLHPNPTSGTTYLHFLAENASEAQLRILDMSGREVLSPINKAVFAGENTLSWDMQTLASGIYMAELRVGESVFVSKVVKE